LYAHLNDINVNNGTTVSVGQTFAKSGGEPGAKNSVNSTSPHLHFEVRRTKNKPSGDKNKVRNEFFNIKGEGILDPLTFLKKKEYTVLVGLDPDENKVSHSNYNQSNIVIV
jgi:murein DD-endopeptidase MepM/ murein hydrolase activator NlpD